MAYPRYSTIRSEHIDYGFWLVFDSTGGVRLSRGQPNIGRGERAMMCNATLPKTLFRTPELKASIAIGEAVPAEFNIDIEAAGEALKQVIGVDVDLRVERPDA